MIDDLFNELIQPANSIDATALLVNLAVAAVLAFALSWHYVRFGRTYSNRRELAQVFPLIVLSTVLIISIVKSSVALSLGVVGALSIVRFRTAIKEPEELAYLFLAIAIGIGLGADQLTVTLLATLVIMVVLVIRSLPLVGQPASQNLYLNVEAAQADEQKAMLRTLDAYLARQTNLANLRRFDVRDGVVSATYFVTCAGREEIVALLEGLHQLIPNAAISFVEQNGIPSR
jgi:uncharacterized membrane protein YhiD involved in acid resistance